MEALQYCTMNDYSYFRSCTNVDVTSSSQLITLPVTPPTVSINSRFQFQTTSIINNNNTNMDDIKTPEQWIDPTLEPQTRNRCNTWPRRPILDSPSIHDCESNPADTVIKEEEPSDFNQTDLGDDGHHNLSGGADGMNVTNQLGLSGCSELGSQGDLNAKKQSARKNAWGKKSKVIFTLSLDLYGMLV